jgi:hypothetical protein
MAPTLIGTPGRTCAVTALASVSSPHTFEVAVLDQGQRRVDRAADVVARRVDRRVEPGRTAGPLVAAQPVADPEHGPAQHRGKERAGEHADPGLVSQGGVVGCRRSPLGAAS